MAYQGLNTTGTAAQQLMMALALANRRRQQQQQQRVQGYNTPYTNAAQGQTTSAPALTPQDASASAGPSATD